MSKQVRVRYQYNKEGKLVSSRPIMTEGGMVDVVINEANLSFQLLRVGSTTVIYLSDTLYPSMQALKKAVKTVLVAQGATFDAEFRIREEYNRLDEISDLNWSEEQTPLETDVLPDTQEQA